MSAGRLGTGIASLALIASVVMAPSPQATTEVVFAYTGTDQTWTVPEGVTSIEISLIGAGGGGGQAGIGSTAFGGGGGTVSGTLTVVPGDTLTLIVGQGGINDNVSNAMDRNYRFGGGASGAGVSGSWPFTWGSGGGRTAVRSSDTLYGTTGDVLTAGGGGGGGYRTDRGAGGAGGGTSGSRGERGDTGNPVTGEGGGGGGTQSAGGAAGGPSEPGVAGIQYAGGYAVISGASEAGGGGGGYYGGGGAGNNGGGGGGSSYLGTASYFLGSTTAGSGRNPGVSSWPAACGSNPGRGADPGASSSVGTGGNGCVVIRFTAAVAVEEAPPPPPWLQAYGRPSASSICTQGWNPSWARWPNDNTGGFTCERRIEYVSERWQERPGFPP